MKKAKRIKTAVSVGLACVLVAGLFAAIGVSHKASPVQALETSIEADGTLGYTLSEGGIQMTAMRTSAQANTNQTTLTVTSPTGITGSQLNWSVAFVNPSSAWASGKSVSDYVSVTASASSPSATVTCKQAFGEQIKVTAALKSNAAVKAECTCEYEAKLDGFYLHLSATNSDTAEPISADFEFEADNASNRVLSLGVFGFEEIFFEFGGLETAGTRQSNVWIWDSCNIRIFINEEAVRDIYENNYFDGELADYDPDMICAYEFASMTFGSGGSWRVFNQFEFSEDAVREFITYDKYPWESSKPLFYCEFLDVTGVSLSDRIPLTFNALPTN